MMVVCVDMIREIKVKYDKGPSKTLSYETIVQIFDKRQIARGIRQLKNEFKVKRRQFLEQGKHENYRKIVIQYTKLIEGKLESNLQHIAKKVKLRRIMDD